MSQQAAEKAIKALHYASGARAVLGHSVKELVLSLPVDFDSLRQHTEDAAVLDQYYIPTRYPNGLPAGTPSDAYTEKQAQTAVHSTESILAAAAAVMPSRP